MEIRFKSNRLERTFGGQKELVARFGAENARKIMMRVHELRSVPDLSHISRRPPPRLHELHGDLEGCYAVDVRQPFRLVFRPTLPERDLSRIRSITILEVMDYHGE